MSIRTKNHEENIGSVLALYPAPVTALGAVLIGFVENCEMRVTKMKTLILGTKSPLEVPAVGLGCMGMVSAYPPIPNKQDMVHFTREAVEIGGTFFDTAEVYGPYTSEEILGEALQGVRNRVKIATKFGFDIQNGKSVGLDSRPETIRKSVEGSLRRLKTDYIDLLYQHRADPKVPVEAVAETVSRLMEEGKILHWGMSEVSIKTLRKAHAILPLTAIENEYSIWYRDAEQELIPTLEELGIGLVSFCPLGRGYLTGNLHRNNSFDKEDVRASMPRFSSEKALMSNSGIMEFIQQHSVEKRCTPAQFALAWIMAQKPWIVPIPGTTKVERLRENLNADSVIFSLEEMQLLNSELKQIQIIGARYNEQQESLLEKNL